MSSRLGPGVLAILGTSAALLGQTAERQEAQPSQAPVFRSGADLVRLDVRATEEDGRTITDLRADEIEVYEEGSQRPVLLFQRVAQPLGTYLEAAQRTISAEVSTNQGCPRGSVYVLVFDQTHIAPGNEQRARLAAQRFLQTRVRPGDRVALYALPGPGPQNRLHVRRVPSEPGADLDSRLLGGSRPWQREHHTHPRGLRNHARKARRS